MANQTLIPSYEEIVGRASAVPSYEDIVGHAAPAAVAPQGFRPEPIVPDGAAVADWLDYRQSLPEQVEQLHGKTGIDRSELIPALMDIGADPTTSGLVREQSVQRWISRRQYQGFTDELSRSWQGMSERAGAAGLQLWSDLQRGQYAVGLGNMYGIPELPPPETGVKARQWAQRLWEDAKSERYQPGQGGGFLGFVAQTTGQVVPFVGLSLSAGLVGGPMAAFGVSATVEGDDLYRSALAEGATEEQAQLTRIMGGTAIGLLEVLEVNRLVRFGKAVSPQVQQSITKQFVDAVAQRSAKKMAQAGGRLTVEQAKVANYEGFIEVLQEWAGEGTAILVYGKYFDAADMLYRSGMSYAGGFVGSALMSPAFVVLRGEPSVDAQGQEQPRPPMVMTEEQYAQYEQQQKAVATAAEQKSAPIPAPSAPTAIEPTGRPTQGAVVTGPGAVMEVPGEKEKAEAQVPVPPADADIRTVAQPAAVAGGTPASAEGAARGEVAVQTVTLYHGTDATIEPKDLNVSAPVYEGSLGPGIYFGQDRQTAQFYGKNVLAVPVRLANPLVIDAAEGTNYRPEAEAQAQREQIGAYDSILQGEQVMPFDVRIAGVWVPIRSAADLASLSARAQAAGHDALIVRGIRDNATVNEEVVVFDRSQINPPLELSPAAGKPLVRDKYLTEPLPGHTIPIVQLPTAEIERRLERGGGPHKRFYEQELALRQKEAEAESGAQETPDIRKPARAEDLRAQEIGSEARSARAQTPSETPAEPERKISRAAERVQEEAIAKDLAESLGELPTYETMSMAEQARMAAEEIARDYENAKQMAYGKIPPPAGLRPASIYRVVAVKARTEGDVETLRNLAVVYPQISLELTAMGQEIKAADVGTLADPVKAMQDLQKVKEKAAAKRHKVKNIKEKQQQWAKEMKQEVTKHTTRRQSWEQFVESLRC